ncbi:MAG TPA: hypothetical protein VKV96_01890 [Roseiarcus sp.]|nr:hypothetical protein [Roseiarcus sp.]
MLKRAIEAYCDPTPKSIQEYLMLFGSARRPEALLDLLEEIDDRGLFWPTLHQEWTTFDAIPQAEFVKRFRLHRPLWSRDFWSDDERTIFDALPDPFKAFWGGDASRRPTYCWTLDFAVAKKFALGHRGMRHPKPTVHTAQIFKSTVCMFLNERNESEVVLFRKPWQSRRKAINEP